MRRRRVLLGLLLGLLLVCGGILGGLWGVLSPDEAAPRPSRTARAPKQQAEPLRRAPAPIGACSLDVEVLRHDDQPAPGVEIALWPGEELAEAELALLPPEQLSGWGGPTDPDGRILLEGLPCIPIRVFAAGSLQNTMEEVVLSGRERVQLRMVPEGRLRVRMVDTRGTPVPGASISVDPGTWSSTDESPGVHLVTLPLDQPVKLSAGLFRFRPTPPHRADSETVEVTLTTAEAARAGEDGVAEELTLTLDLDRVVLVHCAGMPEDSCEGIGPIHCTEPIFPIGEICHGGEITTCICPAGNAAIRGGGASARVRDHENEVWLDLSFGGGLAGRLVQDGQPVSCRAQAIRMPDKLEDLPRGAVVAREARCDTEGRFRIQGLPPGDWYVEVDGEGRAVTLPSQRVGSRMVDLGDIELWAGGGFEGTLLDGLTGEPERGAPMMALKVAGPDERRIPAATESDKQGHFLFEGLPPGEWDVFAVQSPFRTVRVRVDDGAITDGVIVRTAEASLLEENGFSLGTEGGAIVVESVEPDGPAAENGLLPGDAIVGVTVMGFDSTSLPPEYADKLTEGLLGHWGGPGVGLVVERGGALYDIALE